jgi:hypothetical protein
MKIAQLLLLVPCVAFTAERPAEVVALVEKTRTVPADFAADAFIRLGTLNRLDKAWRMELLEEAFQRAAGAQDEFRRRPSSVEFEGQSGFLERVSLLETDRMSLRLRVVEALLTDAPAKARELFLKIDPPRLPALTCTDALAFDLAGYYEVLGKVAASAFSDQEKAEEGPFRLLVRSLAVRHPAQVGPVAKLLATAALTDGQFNALLKTWQEGLRTMRGDDRSFSFARGAGLQVKQLLAAIEKRGGKSTATLEAYRVYLVRHFTPVRCADNTRIGVKITLGSLPSEMDELQAAANTGAYFNETLRKDPVKPLSIDEQLAERAEGEAVGLNACISDECKALAGQYRALILGPNNFPLNPDEKLTDAWRASLGEYLSAIDQWKQAAGMSAAEHFRLKASAYSDLVSVAPPGASRLTAVKALAGYLKATRETAERRSEWLLPVKRLVGRMAVDPMGWAKEGEELAASGDAVISLYVQLEKVAPQTPDRIIPLL